MRRWQSRYPRSCRRWRPAARQCSRPTAIAGSTLISGYGREPTRKSLPTWRMRTPTPTWSCPARGCSRSGSTGRSRAASSSRTPPPLRFSKATGITRGRWRASTTRSTAAGAARWRPRRRSSWTATHWPTVTSTSSSATSNGVPTRTCSPTPWTSAARSSTSSGSAISRRARTSRM